jgi:hypothetical protein
MVKQYYQPQLSEIFSGYEYEQHWTIIDDTIGRSSGWDPKVISDILMYGDTLSKGLLNKSIRVPYLTIEQIKAEGWTITLHDTKPSPYLVNWINATKGTFDLWINLAMTDKMLLGVNNNKHIIFRGQCKSINEFRTLMTWLQIN